MNIYVDNVLFFQHLGKNRKKNQIKTSPAAFQVGFAGLERYPLVQIPKRPIQTTKLVT